MIEYYKYVFENYLLSKKIFKNTCDYSYSVNVRIFNYELRKTVCDSSVSFKYLNGTQIMTSSHSVVVTGEMPPFETYFIDTHGHEIQIWIKR